MQSGGFLTCEEPVFELLGLLDFPYIVVHYELSMVFNQVGMLFHLVGRILHDFVDDFVGVLLMGRFIETVIPYLRIDL